MLSFVSMYLHSKWINSTHRFSSRLVDEIGDSLCHIQKESQLCPVIYSRAINTQQGLLAH